MGMVVVANVVAAAGVAMAVVIGLGFFATAVPKHPTPGTETRSAYTSSAKYSSESELCTASPSSCVASSSVSAYPSAVWWIASSLTEGTWKRLSLVSGARGEAEKVGMGSYRCKRSLAQKTLVLLPATV